MFKNWLKFFMKKGTTKNKEVYHKKNWKAELYKVTGHRSWCFIGEEHSPAWLIVANHVKKENVSNKNYYLKILKHTR